MPESDLPINPINDAAGNSMDYRCATCGAAVPGVAEFCSRCGARLYTTDGMVAEYRPPVPRAVRITAIVALIVIGLMIVTAIVGAMFN